MIKQVFTSGISFSEKAVKTIKMPSALVYPECQQATKKWKKVKEMIMNALSEKQFEKKTQIHDETVHSLCTTIMHLFILSFFHEFITKKQHYNDAPPTISAGHGPM